MSTIIARADRATLAELGVSGTPLIDLPFEYEPPIALHGVNVFADVRIGRHSYMNNGMIRPCVSVGRFCSIGRNVVIAAADHPLDALTTHPVAWQARAPLERPQSSLRAKKSTFTEIGHDVWIGDNVVVVSGVRIGNGAVVGANSVVTRDVPPYSIVGGVPARLIRTRFSDPIVDRLIASEWWLLHIESVRKLDVNDIEACLEEIPRLKAEDGIDPIDFQLLALPAASQ